MTTLVQHWLKVSHFSNHSYGTTEMGTSMKKIVLVSDAQLVFCLYCEVAQNKSWNNLVGIFLKMSGGDRLSHITDSRSLII